MTNDELQAIRQRCDAATPGPWTELIVYATGGAQPDPAYCGTKERIAAYCYHSNASNDIRFIAHARQDVPALLAEIERLRAIISDARDAYWNASGSADGAVRGNAGETGLAENQTWTAKSVNSLRP